MNADVKGALEQIDNSYKAFIHNGKSMTKQHSLRTRFWQLEDARPELREQKMKDLINEFTLTRRKK
jgi:hypothetical protein